MGDYVLIIVILACVFLFTACGEESKEYREFVKKYGSNTRTYCDDKGFLMRETFLSKQAKAPREYLIDSQECLLKK